MAIIMGWKVKESKFAINRFNFSNIDLYIWQKKNTYTNSSRVKLKLKQVLLQFTIIPNHMLIVFGRFFSSISDWKNTKKSHIFICVYFECIDVFPVFPYNWNESANRFSLCSKHKFHGMRIIRAYNSYVTKAIARRKKNTTHTVHFKWMLWIMSYKETFYSSE